MEFDEIQKELHELGKKNDAQIVLDNTLRLFKQSKVTRFYKNKDIIHVDYEVDGVGDQFNYNVRKGTFEYDR